MNKQELINKYKELENGTFDIGALVVCQSILKDLEQLDEPKPVTIPQFVADWYEENEKDFEIKLFRAIESFSTPYEEGDPIEFLEWLVDGNNKPIQTLVNMHQFGYEVEKEKRYLVKMKDVDSRTNYLYYGLGSKSWLFKTKLIDGLFRKSHTRKELEDAGFAWVLDCPGIELEEVTE